MSSEPEYDKVTDNYTTGHEWDGIKELNTPLPRWWLWTLYATILWAIGYWIVMPAWPLIDDYSRGLWHYSQRDVVEKKLDQARATRRTYSEKLLAADLATIKNDPDLLEFSMAAGKAVFGDNCAGCHGTGAAGAVGYPNLNDDAWLWGGTLDDIHTTITVGIRSHHDDTRLSDMPAFLKDELLDEQQIRTVAAYVAGLSTDEPHPDSGPGAVLFEENCAACHGPDGRGDKMVGAPDLGDDIWLYGGDMDSLITSISFSRKGVMPAWDGRLDPATIKSLAVYIHALGGGT